jgi:protein O-GlcNAc transferase
MLYRGVLERSPRNADAMNMLGILFAQRGDQASALEWIRKAVDIDSQSAAFRFNYGKALLQFRLAPEACEVLEHAVALDPRYADAYNELGLARAESGSPEPAERAFRKAVSLRPDYWEAHNNLGLLLHRLARKEDAERSLRRALELAPRSPEVLKNLGVMLRAQGRAEEAVQAYRAALASAPAEPGILTNLGNALGDLSRTEEAIDCFRSAVAGAPGFADAYYNWGALLLRLRRLHEAADKFRAALAVDPGLGEAEGGLASVLQDMGLVDEAVAAGRRALGLRPDDADMHSQLLFSLLHMSAMNPRQILDEHREWARRHAERISSRSVGHANARDPRRRLRIGYVSGDFRRHSVAQFFEPVLAEHDREGFEIFCYHNLPSADETTGRLRRLADGWREIAALGDDATASLIRADRIDVLVDLSGHTKYNRLLVFAREPAPVQVTWLGYPETTGLVAVGYRISDTTADPPEKGNLATETLVRLPDGFHCYRPPAEAPPVSALPASAAGCVTFGTFNSLAKVSSEATTLWRRILAAVPGSRLLIKSQPLADPGTRSSFVDRLGARGIPAHRLECVPGTSGLAEHLAWYHKVDIALDTFPYNGTTTTCEALWMGVPVVTLAGDRHSGRVGASLLARIGMEDLIAPTHDAYVALAAALARDSTRLSSLRAGMRARMSASPLMDAKRLARNLEQAYRSAWRRWCENPGLAVER